MRPVKRALLALLTVILFTPPASAADVRIEACASALSAIHKDWQATEQLFQRWGPHYEANPIIQQIGPGVYFATYAVGIAALCKENVPWRVLTIIIWAVHTQAVNTHIPYGTSMGPPLLFITLRF